MLHVFGFFFVFVLGGLTGVMLAMVPFDWQAHDSYFIVAHLHYVLIGGMVFPVFAAIYYWLPLVNGKAVSPTDSSSQTVDSSIPRSSSTTYTTCSVIALFLCFSGCAGQWQTAAHQQSDRLAPRLQLAAETFDQAATHGQTQSKAIGLAGVERGKQLRQLLLADARALVLYLNLDTGGTHLPSRHDD